MSDEIKPQDSMKTQDEDAGKVQGVGLPMALAAQRAALIAAAPNVVWLRTPTNLQVVADSGAPE